MKRILFLILLMLITSIGFPAIHYVGTGGDFTTLTQVNAHTFVEGDQILFKRGETFYGSLTISQSGAVTNPITYGAYGTGANPIITGFTAVTAWTNLGSNIWESTSAVSTLTTLNVVTINGVNTAMGRYPNIDASNGGYLPFQSHSGATSITSSSLTGTPDWTGAEVAVRVNRFVIDRKVITSQSGSTLNFSALRFEPTEGNGFFIQNDIRTLDAQNEWYYNPATKKIRIYSTTQPINVKVSTVENIIVPTGDYLTFENLSITGGNTSLLFNNNSTQDHVIIRNSSFAYSGKYSIGIRCNYLTIDNNVISESNHKGIDVFYSKNSVITNNTIQNTAQSVGMINSSEDQAGTAILIRLDSQNSLVEYNRVINSGYCGIVPLSDSITISKNYIDTFCNVLNDGGGIYTWMGSASVRNQTKILDNIILNGIGANVGTNVTISRGAHGIYLDLDSENTDIGRNTVSNCGYGIFLNGVRKINVHDNICYNNENSQYYQTSLLASEWHPSDNIITSNQFISKQSTQLSAKFFSQYDNIASEFGEYTLNYYARPIDENLTFSVQQATGGLLLKTFTQWQTFSSQDANSHASPRTITDISDLSFYYNATSLVDTVFIPDPAIDITGFRYATEIILQPFESVALIKDGESYYVASNGSDSNDGLTELTPWQTLTKVNATTLDAGSNVLFKKGDTFYGSLIVYGSGNSTNPITFGAYGTGVNPTISGFTTVSAWTNLGSNIWESTDAVSTLSTCNMVSVNGVNTPMGRYPNTGYLTFQAHSGTSSITSSSLTGTPNWTGATAVVRTSDYTLDKAVITGQLVGTLNLGMGLFSEPANGWGFFIQNDSRTLDNPNEWYYNPSTKKIQIYSTTKPTNIKVASVTNLLTINGDYVTINGIDFIGANGSGIYNATNGIDHVAISNCNVSFSGNDGIKFRGDYCSLENNTILYSNNTGLNVQYLRNSTVKNNTIQYSGLLAGMGSNGIRSSYGIDGYETGSTLFEYNKILNTGYIGISFYGNSVIVKNNFIDTFNSILQDGGGLYTSVGGDPATTGCVIRGNIIINGVGATVGTTSGEQAHGIYLDDFCKDFEVYGNTSANNNGRGIFLHNNTSINLHDNTTFNNVGELLVSSFSLNSTNSANSINGNKFISATDWTRTAEFGYTFDDWTKIGSFNNNYYARPLSELATIRVKTPTISYVDYTVANWITLSGLDVNSKKSPKYLSSANDMTLVYNDTQAAKSITLPFQSIGIDGKKIATVQVLQPYTSLVVIKDLNNPNNYKKAVYAPSGKILLDSNGFPIVMP